jgi:L-fucose isomerase-like protein
MFKPKMGFTVIYHPQEVGAERSGDLLSKYSQILRGFHLDIVKTEPLHDERTATEIGKKFRDEQVDVICLLLATWSSDEIVMDLLEECDVPIIVWGLPGIHTGSHCGAQQINCVLREINKPCKSVYKDDASTLQEIVSYSKAAALMKRLRKTRLGLIGYRINGMTETAFDEFGLKEVFGTRIVHMDIGKLEKIIKNIRESEAIELWERVKTQVGEVLVNEEAGLFSAKAYFALKKFISENFLSGITVKCVYDFMGRVCLPFSLLSEEGIVGGCEGDINGTLAMLMLHELTGKSVNNTDFLEVYSDDNTAVFSHCGSTGFSLAQSMKDISFKPIRLAEEGLCVLFPTKPGNVTLVNLVGRKGTFRMCIVKAEAIKTDLVFPGNPTRIRLPVPTDEFLKIIAREGIGHHWMIGYGDVSRELTEFADLVGIKAINIG